VRRGNGRRQAPPLHAEETRPAHGNGGRHKLYRSTICIERWGNESTFGGECFDRSEGLCYGYFGALQDALFFVGDMIQLLGMTLLAGPLANLIEQTGWVARVVLLMLLGFSLFSWALIFQKSSRFSRLRSQTALFLSRFPLESGLARSALDRQYRARRSRRCTPAGIPGAGTAGESRWAEREDRESELDKHKHATGVGGRNSQARAIYAVAGDDGFGDAVHWIVRDGLGSDGRFHWLGRDGCGEFCARWRRALLKR